MIKKILKFILKIIVAFVVISVITVVLFKFVNPPVTPLMVIRVIEGIENEKSAEINQEWVSYDEISPNLFKALIAAEDARFFTHSGIDWKAVDEAKKYNARYKGKKVRGASTISMQTARNTFLWHGKTYFRKVLEVYFTTLIEAIWGKKRILEVYANVIEWGDGVYGAEVAAKKYFRRPAVKLNASQAALMTAVLPNPRRWSPARPTKYMLKRQRTIRARMRAIALPKDD